MGRKLMPVTGMTCADCQGRVTDALVQAGARDVRVNYRLGQVQLDPAAATEERLRSAVEELGYRAGSLRAVPAAAEAGRDEKSSGAWGFLFLLLPVLCCGGPLLLVAIVASGAGAWLAANRFLVASAVALVVGLVFAGLWIRRRGGLAR